MGFQNVGLADISNAKQKAILSISETDHSAPREEKGSITLFSARQFCKYKTHLRTRETSFEILIQNIREPKSNKSRMGRPRL